MSGEGGAGKVGLAPRYGEGSGLEGAPDPVRPSLALRLGEAMPPVQSRFRLGFCCKEGRGVVRVLLAATYGAVAFILSGGICGVVRVFPAPAEGDGGSVGISAILPAKRFLA